jgi:hypothetical protein
MNFLYVSEKYSKISWVKWDKYNMEYALQKLMISPTPHQLHISFPLIMNFSDISFDITLQKS